MADRYYFEHLPATADRGECWIVVDRLLHGLTAIRDGTMFFAHTSEKTAQGHIDYLNGKPVKAPEPEKPAAPLVAHDAA